MAVGTEHEPDLNALVLAWTLTYQWPATVSSRNGNTEEVGQTFASEAGLVRGGTTAETSKSENGGGTRQLSSLLAPVSTP
jgi:hypothetical protein